MQDSPRLKTSLEVRRIRRASQPIGELFAELPRIIIPGLAVDRLRDYCCSFLESRGVEPALKGFKGFPEPLCISINNVAAHGTVMQGVLHAGDLVTIDITARRDGWHGDAAWTFAVGDVSPQSKRLLRCAWQATREGIGALKAGGRLNLVGEAVERVARRYGCSVLPYFVGHGIGEAIHEAPKVIHTRVEQLPIPVVPGLVVTIEPILSLGSGETKLLADGWSQATMDGSVTAQFEHTVAVFSNYTEVLTLEDQNLLSLDFPPYV